MKINKIQLKNYRNLADILVNFNKNTNIFIGDNAHGKTNILESIYTLALTKSHKNVLDSDLIKESKEFLKINGIVEYKSHQNDYEVIITNDDKKLKINGVEEKKVYKYVSKINIILFTPDHLDIIKKSPQNRRNLLNTELCQLDSNYTIVLNEYNRILKMRNDYLKQERKYDYKYLSILTEKLVDKALIIYKYRENFINEVNLYINKVFKKITNKDNIKIIYEKSINLIDKEDIIKFLQSNIDKEVNQKTTLFGPHRDDFSFYLEDKDMKRFSSQGYQRIAVLALKLSEINVFKKETKEYPIVLLDDIFSEIDLKKRNLLLKLIKSNIQYMITTTDLNNINKKILSSARVFQVKDGLITEKEGKKNGK